jgi:hypothetical protein
MAITYQSGSVYIDVAGLAVTGRTKIAHMIFTGANKTDSVTLIDNTSGTTPVKIVLTGSSTASTQSYYFSVPMLFNTGIYCSAISASCSLTLITTAGGE